VNYIPGPWVVEWSTRSGYSDSGVKGWHVDNGDAGEPVICEIPDDERADGSSRAANARLIAAAPDLLAALKEVVAISDRKHDAWDKAHAAIAKAQGETP